jgi:hypothetical protein
MKQYNPAARLEAVKDPARFHPQFKEPAAETFGERLASAITDFG